MVTLVNLPSGIMVITETQVSQGNVAHTTRFLMALGVSETAALEAIERITDQDLDAVKGPIQIPVA